QGQRQRALGNAHHPDRAVRQAREGAAPVRRRIHSRLLLRFGGSRSPPPASRLRASSSSSLSRSDLMRFMPRFWTEPPQKESTSSPSIARNADRDRGTAL